METFEQETHRVIEEHRATRRTAMAEWLAERCRCEVRHTRGMVEGSLAACPSAAADPGMQALDAVLWMLTDLHATLFPDDQHAELLS